MNHDHEHKHYIYTVIHLQYCVQINANTHVKKFTSPFISEVEANGMYPTVIHLGHLVSRQMLRMTYQAVMSLHQQKFCAI